MNKELKHLIKQWLFNKTEFQYDNYYVSKDTVYYEKISKEPLLRFKYDGKLLVNFHTKHKNQLVKLFKVFSEIDDPKFHKNILLVCYIFNEKIKLDIEKNIYDDILNMVTVYSDEKIFYMFKKYKLDFKLYLINYINFAENSSSIFDEIYDEEIYDDPHNENTSRKLLGKQWNPSLEWRRYMTKNNNDDIIFKIKDESIRNELLTLKRTVKIKRLLADFESN